MALRLKIFSFEGKPTGLDYTLDIYGETQINNWMNGLALSKNDIVDFDIQLMVPVPGKTKTIMGTISILYVG